MSPSIAAEVGRFYMVPCIFINPQHRQHWMPADGWVATLGTKHTDPELASEHVHYHVDWRFCSEQKYDLACGIHVRPHGRVITSSDGWYTVGSTVLKRRKCHRAMTDFPSQAKPLTRGYEGGVCTKPLTRWAQLERTHACTKLKPGNICPHRGIDLTPFVKPDGTVICPGHGLRWDTKTGELLPHHTLGTP